MCGWQVEQQLLTSPFCGPGAALVAVQGPGFLWGWEEWYFQTLSTSGNGASE